ncbi:MAG: hypothetical protein KGS45_08575 [Planctomycetes bacterium]|nr:hypothetical protein [Planctomycetota bacterium]
MKETQRQTSNRMRVVARPVVSRAGVNSVREALVLVAGMAAMAGLLTSCAGSKSRGSDGMISSGLDALTDPGAKQPKLNRKAEIARPDDEESAYAKLADQATLDLNALLEARGKKKSGADAGHSEAAAALSDRKPRQPLQERQGESEQGTLADSTSPNSGSAAPTSAARSGEIASPNAGLNRAIEETTERPTSPDASWADDPSRTIPPGERPKAASRFAKDANPANAVNEATREAMKVSEKGAAPSSMTADGPPAPVPEVPVFKGVNAALCTKVTGFGKLEAMPIRKGRNAFVFPAARVNRAIVYVELENFGYRPAKSTDPDFASGDAWAVELSTEIQLLDDPDSILQFKERERTVIETGRNKRRDFYLVQEIELPPTLTVGAYNLKLILRDKSGAEPVRSEIVLPVQIVADVTASVEEK